DKRFLPLRFPPPGGRRSAFGGYGVQLLDMPPLRRLVGLLPASSSAHVAPRSPHRRLHVERQVHRVPPLPELRLCLALGCKAQAQPDGCQRAPHAPGDPRRRPRTPPLWRRHQSLHRL
ncbi:MAG: hypothetical protein AVDCRST_MAG58-2502, partial [uncultured Rubrobacteraceae bacterium]